MKNGKSSGYRRCRVYRQPCGESFVAKGHQATVYDNLSTGQKVNLFEKAEFVEGDILDSGRLFDTMRGGFDAVVHLAAKKAVGESMENPDKYSINNIQGALNILMAMSASGIRHIVFLRRRRFTECLNIYR